MATPAGSAYTVSTSGKNFVIWFGSPGVYDKEDKNHDQAWYNYVNPMMRIAEAGMLDVKKGDTMYWCLYSTGYNTRWDADQKSDRKFILDHVAKVKKYGSKDYVDHVKRRAAEFSSRHGYKIIVKELPAAKNFWDDLKSYPDKSVASVWYFGHGYKDLWLTLEHNASHVAKLNLKDGLNYINRLDIPKHNTNISKKFYDVKIPSKFYGCNTIEFAEEWFILMGVAAQGADGTMQFGTWENDITKILSTLESGITKGSLRGAWKVYQ